MTNMVPAIPPNSLCEPISCTIHTRPTAGFRMIGSIRPVSSEKWMMKNPMGQPVRPLCEMDISIPSLHMPCYIDQVEVNQTKELL
ncbi:MAG: hypothetical protein HQL52_07675 [Magnetococcales bacterium]|nr:hypothetical protein [Magnetococcales bacterium]